MAQKFYKKEPVVRQAFRPSYPPSAEQDRFFEASQNGTENLMLDAKAGSGKSTTIIWEQALDYQRGHRPKAAMAAFNSSIVSDIERRCADHVTVKTFHAFGRQALVKAFGQPTLLEDKLFKILKEYKFLNPDPYPFGPAKAEILTRLMETKNLVEKMKVCLINEHDQNGIDDTLFNFNIEIDKIDWVKEVLPEIFQKICANPQVIDFTDMMWLAIRMDLNIEQFDKLYVDEAQDLNPLMMAYATKMVAPGGRIIMVGDPRQSIYKFAGADSKSMEKLIAHFKATALPLNTCYRCGSNIILEAQKIVPEIMAHPSTGEGIVNRFEELPPDIQEGSSMILSRRNANLIRPCFRLLKEGKKAVIKGRDIGSNLVSLIDKMKATSIPDLMEKCDTWEDEKIRKIMESARFSASLLEGTQDQAECIRSIAEECKTVDEMKFKISSLFDEKRAGITLSSMHRSKGLEADHVIIVDYRNVRLNHEKMSEEDHKQEANLNYVGVTRPKKRLDLVG